MADVPKNTPDEVERALTLLVMAARTSPPMRDAVAVVEDEIRRLRRAVDAAIPYIAAANEVAGFGCQTDSLLVRTTLSNNSEGEHSARR